MTEKPKCEKCGQVKHDRGATVISRGEMIWLWVGVMTISGLLAFFLYKWYQSSL